MAANLKTTPIKEYLKIFNSNIDVVLLNENITQLSFVDAIVNSTGKNFDHLSNYAMFYFRTLFNSCNFI